MIFEFYERFANDSVFQLSRLHEPLKFVTADPEDEFQILETTKAHSFANLNGKLGISV